MAAGPSFLFLDSGKDKTMRRKLSTQMRTVYETTVLNPHTFRVTVKTKDMVEQSVLEEAVAKTMKRYPYFAMQIDKGENEIFFADNPRPMIVLHRDDPPVLGSEEVNGHLLNISWWKNKIHIDVYHALTDGGGIYPMIKTLLYYYCSSYYEMDLSTDGSRLSDDPVDPKEAPPVEIRLQDGHPQVLRLDKSRGADGRPSEKSEGPGGPGALPEDPGQLRRGGSGSLHGGA